MYPNPIPLNDGSANVNYDFRGASDNSSRYQCPSQNGSLSEARTLTIRHQATQVNSINEKRRSVMRIDTPVMDGAGNKDVMSTYIVQISPVRIVQDVDVEASLAQVKAFLTATGYAAKFGKGEI